MIQEGVRLIQETVEERQEGVTDPLERLFIVLDTTFDVIMEYQEIAHFALLGGCEGVAHDVKTGVEQAREAFEADIEARVREIVGDRWDSTMMARVLFGALEGAVGRSGARPRRRASPRRGVLPCLRSIKRRKGSFAPCAPRRYRVSRRVPERLEGEGGAYGEGKTGSEGGTRW